MGDLSDIYDLAKGFSEVLGIARHYIKHPDKPIDKAKLSETIFELQDEQKSLRLLTELETTVNELFVLALASKFERILRDEYSVQASLIGNTTAERRLTQKLAQGIEQWKLADDIVDFAITVNANAKGQIKQVIGFRNWVAHGHKHGLTPEQPVAQVTPFFAFKLLDDYLNRVVVT